MTLIGHRLEIKRKQLKLSQMAAARMLGVSLLTYQLWEHNVSTPNEDNMKKVNQFLNERE
jgi:DNA-binding transcriptional regulator YiaG